MFCLQKLFFFFAREIKNSISNFRTCNSNVKVFDYHKEQKKNKERLFDCLKCMHLSKIRKRNRKEMTGIIRLWTQNIKRTKWLIKLLKLLCNLKDTKDRKGLKKLVFTMSK